MLKKAGVAAAVLAAGFLIATPFAYADDSGDSHIQIGGRNAQDNIVQLPIQACNNSGGEGVSGGHVVGQKNEDSHDGKCAQQTKAEDNSGN